MYIRRKVFSHIQNENGEVKLFSTTDYEMNDSKEVIRMFAEKKESKKRKVSLEQVESNKGLKRAIITALPTGGGSLTGGYIAKGEADKADKEGADDKEIVRRAKKKGLEVGALTGAAIGGLTALKTGSAIPVVVGAGLGALGGRNAAGVNTKDRLRKRALKETGSKLED